MNEERFFKEGKSWVMKTIKHLVDELSIPIENIEWGPVELTDEDKNKYPIAIQASGKRKVFKFTYSEIVDVQNSKEVQQVLENRLLDFLRSFGASGKKIGF